MLDIEELETGSLVVHKNTGLRYSVIEISDEEAAAWAERFSGIRDA